MYLLISDANILIDLEEGQLLEVFFNLPYQFKVPDVLFHEELSDQHGYLLELGLLLGELSPESMMYSFELRQKGYRKGVASQATRLPGALNRVPAVYGPGVLSRQGLCRSYRPVRVARQLMQWALGHLAGRRREGL